MMEMEESGLGDYSFESVTKWSTGQVATWLRSKNHSEVYVKHLCEEHEIDGKSLLLLTEADLRNTNLQFKVLGDLKRLYFDILELQHFVSHPSYPFTSTSHSHSHPFIHFNPHFIGEQDSLTTGSSAGGGASHHRKLRRKKRKVTFVDSTDSQLSDDIASADSSAGKDVNGHHGGHHHHSASQGYATVLEPEVGKALVAMAYVFIVTWITALVMVIVHDRVPDMEKYPPLPDLFLDNMPHIPWAFEMCEVTGTILFCIWIGVLFFHKHRFILIRRFFALSGTVFLLRCVTMLITSLSVPGTHLQCNPRVMPYGDWLSRLYNAYLIWKGAGMSIQGVRTCGDYMFSGHTVALTMLNFFVTEYSTRRLYYIHTLSWLLNMFGIFFILAAHEHYSIDVFIAFYITSRLFLYYHTLANNQALMSRDSKRTKVWFPLFSYFESGVDGIVPNQYEWPITPKRVKNWTLKALKTIELKWKENVPSSREGSFLHKHPPPPTFLQTNKPKTS